jgi:nucleoside phosphorylase
VVDLADRLSLFSERWSPKVVVNTGTAGGDLTATHDDSLLE